jgi:hypothetical protein
MTNSVFMAAHGEYRHYNKKEFGKKSFHIDFSIR